MSQKDRVNLQVYVANELCGYIKNQEKDALEVALAESISDGYGDSNYINWKSTTTRYAVMKDRERSRSEDVAGFLNKFNVPPYARGETIFSQMSCEKELRYSWRCINVTIDELERIFDSPGFIPH